MQYNAIQCNTGAITLYTSEFCLQTQYMKNIKELDVFLLEDNKRNYFPIGLQVFNPIENGYRVVRIYKKIGNKNEIIYNQSVNINNKIITETETINNNNNTNNNTNNNEQV